MIYVTGGLGFIGSNLVKNLNIAGYKNITIVDRINNDDRDLLKLANINNLSYTDFIDLNRPGSWERLFGDLKSGDVVFHQGAISDTMYPHKDQLWKWNHSFTRDLVIYSVRNKFRVVYASSAAVYGDNAVLTPEDFSEEQPKNVYGYTKLFSDRFAYENAVGLRYFNVYGERESHKGRMASVIHQKCVEALADKRVTIFHDGSQARDFIHVDDVCRVNMFFGLEGGSTLKGLYNVGTGRKVSFQHIADYITGLTSSSLHFRTMSPEIEKFYQVETQADITKLRKAGYDGKFLSVEAGIEKKLEEISA